MKISEEGWQHQRNYQINEKQPLLLGVVWMQDSWLNWLTLYQLTYPGSLQAVILHFSSFSLLLFFPWSFSENLKFKTCLLITYPQNFYNLSLMVFTSSGCVLHFLREYLFFTMSVYILTQVDVVRGTSISSLVSSVSCNNSTNILSTWLAKEQ